MARELNPGAFIPVSPRLALRFLVPLTLVLGGIASWSLYTLIHGTQVPDAKNLLLIAFCTSGLGTIIAAIWLIKMVRQLALLRQSPLYVAIVSNVWVQKRTFRGFTGTGMSGHSAQVEVRFKDHLNADRCEIIHVVDRSILKAVLDNRLTKGKFLRVRCGSNGSSEIADIDPNMSNTV